VISKAIMAVTTVVGIAATTLPLLALHHDAPPASMWDLAAACGGAILAVTALMGWVAIGHTTRALGALRRY